MAVQLQWGLEHTSASIMQVATGLMRAATTDNVQPLAILACEQFGNTLAISQEAIERVQRYIVPTPEPAVISFLKSTVGFSRDDCVSQLSQNTAGIQFLALANALITTMGVHRSSVAIHAMLAATAKDKTLLPTLRHVRDLLVSIEPRCCHSSLANDVAGWQILLGKSDDVLTMKGSHALVTTGYFPKSEGIQCLVDALRQLRRIGNDDIRRLIIKTTRCAPWTMAFVESSLGYSPTLAWEDGRMIIEQAKSDVTVVVRAEEFNTFDDDFRVIVHSSIHGPCDLVTSCPDALYSGMMTLNSYGDLLRRRSGFDRGLATIAFREALPQALRKTICGLRIYARDQRISEWESSAHQMRPSPFPDDWVISKTCTDLFGEEIELPSFSNDTEITTLPSVSHFILDSTQDNAEPCEDTPQRDQYKSGSSFIPKTDKIEKAFLGNLSFVIADIMSLSLFDCPQPLRVTWNSFNGPLPRPRQYAFVSAILALLKGEKGHSLSLESLLDWALSLVRHDIKDERRWMMSSYKGQTIWPTIFETYTFEGRGFLSLSCLPGVLRHQGDVYQRAEGIWARPPFYDSADGDTIEHQEVLRPCNLYPTIRMHWNVEVSKDALRVSLGAHEPVRGYLPIIRSHWDVLLSITGCFLVPNCAHDPQSALGLQLCPMKFVHPLQIRLDYPDLSCESEENPPKGRESESPGRRPLNLIRVFAVSGDDRLRLLSLSDPGAGESYTARRKFAVRRQACLACCSEFCLRYDVETLII